MLPTFRRLTLQDVPNAPNWISYVFEKVNLFMEQTVATFNKNLTFGENVQGQKYIMSFSTPSDYATGGFNSFNMNYNGGGQPTCCIIGNISEATGAQILTPVTVTDWYLNINANPSNVVINYIAGLQADKKYTVNLIVL